MNIKPGRYRHFKGKEYKVIAVATNSETLEPMVVYQAEYHDEKFGDKAIWVRSLKMFLENVNYKGEIVPRFKYIGK